MNASVSALLLVVLLSGCASTGPRPEEITDVKVTERGVDQPSDDVLCGDFSLTDQQAARFLARAVEVDEHALPDDYHVGPCYVRGTARVGSTRAAWEIRVLGTGKLVVGEGREVLLHVPQAPAPGTGQ